MKILLSLALSAGLIAGPITFGSEADRPATVAPADEAPLLEKLSVQEQLEDFDMMRASLEEAHTGLYRYTTKEVMDRHFALERAKVSKPMTKAAFWLALCETVAGIHCGHTSVDPDEALRKVIEEMPLLPLALHAEDGGLVVQFNSTRNDQTIRPGMRVVAINGRPVADLLPKFEAVMSSDGDVKTGVWNHILKLFPIFYGVAVDSSGRFEIEAVDETGNKIKATLNGVTQVDQANNDNPVNAAVNAAAHKWHWATENQALRFLKEPDIAEIRVQYFVGDDFSQKIKDMFKVLHEKGTKTLILDLRGNGGGQDTYGAMLVSYLTDKPFRYFDHINIKNISPSFKERIEWDAKEEDRLRNGTTPNAKGGFFVMPRLHTGLGEQQPAEQPFLGEVFVLIDGGTFSTAADFCAVVHHLKRATFIGEETGGGYYGNNSGLSVRVALPHSHLQVRIPMYEYWNAVPGYEGKRRGTIPDHPIATKVADLIRGEDAALNLAVELSNQKASR